MPVILREATLVDLPMLKAWDEEPHVVASDPNDDWDWEDDLERPETGREYFIAEADGRPIGAILICDPATEDSHYWGPDAPAHHRAIDIWIGPADALNKGYGTVMMALALEYCFANPDVVAILIDPLATNEDAHRFYERQGFVFLDFRTFGFELCKVYRLLRVDWVSKRA